MTSQRGWGWTSVICESCRQQLKPDCITFETAPTVFSPLPPPLHPPLLLFLLLFRCRFSHLQKHVAELVVDLREERWQPLAYYRTSLLAAGDAEDAASHASSDRRGNVPGRSPSSRPRMEGASISPERKPNILSNRWVELTVAAAASPVQPPRPPAQTPPLSPELLGVKGHPASAQGETQRSPLIKSFCVFLFEWHWTGPSPTPLVIRRKPRPLWTSPLPTPRRECRMWKCLSWAPRRTTRSWTSKSDVQKAPTSPLGPLKPRRSHVVSSSALRCVHRVGSRWGNSRSNNNHTWATIFFL